MDHLTPFNHHGLWAQSSFPLGPWWRKDQPALQPVGAVREGRGPGRPHFLAGRLVHLTFAGGPPECVSTPSRAAQVLQVQLAQGGAPGQHSRQGPRPLRPDPVAVQVQLPQGGAPGQRHRQRPRALVPHPVGPEVQLLQGGGGGGGGGRMIQEQQVGQVVGACNPQPAVPQVQLAQRGQAAAAPFLCGDLSQAACPMGPDRVPLQDQAQGTSPGHVRLELRGGGAPFPRLFLLLFPPS
ncbi:unnamed protein product [Heterosigma akashiwo]|mmetsp:Transcript_6520/g.10413  ORF Transcript_6520/g.10413 Transcript_6520/m.10413 type:complete len:238 (-) Transcript_6520:399-1112(-)